MNKVFVALVLVLVTLTQAALAGSSPHAGGAQKVKASEGQRSNAGTTAANTGHSQCKKYFALIGALVTVPC